LKGVAIEKKSTVFPIIHGNERPEFEIKEFLLYFLVFMEMTYVTTYICIEMY